MNNPGVKERVLEIVHDVARELGYMIYEANLLFKGQNSRIIVRLDNLEGITHSDCEAFTREFTSRLDASEVLPNYSTEVSSPGINREVRNIEEFRRFQGSPVKVVFNVPQGPHIFFKGRIATVENDKVILQDEKEELAVELGAIKSAHLEF
jgi:ribosome maturation factor RimP